MTSVHKVYILYGWYGMWLAEWRKQIWEGQAGKKGGASRKKNIIGGQARAKTSLGQEWYFSYSSLISNMFPFGKIRKIIIKSSLKSLFRCTQFVPLYSHVLENILTFFPQGPNIIPVGVRKWGFFFNVSNLFLFSFSSYFILGCDEGVKGFKGVGGAFPNPFWLRHLTRFHQPLTLILL